MDSVIERGCRGNSCIGFSGQKSRKKKAALVKGFTLVELLICIALIAILTTVTTLASFPKEEDLVKFEVGEALESMIHRAKMIANYYGRPMRIHFIDYGSDKKCIVSGENLGSNSSFTIHEATRGGADNYKWEKENKPAYKDYKKFKKAIKMKPGNPPKEPFFLLTDDRSYIIFFNNQVCYQIIQTPGGQNRKLSGAGGDNEVFSSNGIGGTNSFFTVYPNGTSDLEKISIASYYGDAKTCQVNFDFLGNIISRVDNS